jgi:hypothetical protein
MNPVCIANTQVIKASVCLKYEILNSATVCNLMKAAGRRLLFTIRQSKASKLICGQEFILVYFYSALNILSGLLLREAVSNFYVRVLVRQENAQR